MRRVKGEKTGMNIKKKAGRDPKWGGTARPREDSGFRRRNGADALSSGLRISLELVRVIGDLEKRNFSGMVRMKALSSSKLKKEREGSKENRSKSSVLLYEGV